MMKVGPWGTWAPSTSVTGVAHQSQAVRMAFGLRGMIINYLAPSEKPCLCREQWLINTSEVSLTDKAGLGANLQRQKGTSGGLFSREPTPARALTPNLMKPTTRNKRKISALKINLTMVRCMNFHHLKQWQRKDLLWFCFFQLPLFLQDWQPGAARRWLSS